MAKFDGETFDEDRDGPRLSSQLERLKALMLDGKWRTLSGMAREVNGSEAGISARLRDLRKPKFGGYIVERKYIDEGVWVYRVLKPGPSGQLSLGV